MVGNYSINKGHHLLIDAFKELGKSKPQLHLVLAGHGTDSEKLRKYAEGHPFLDRIHMLGFRADVPAMMKKALFTINASYKEGLSGTVRESLALNVPVLASDIPGNLEIGKLVPIKLFKSGDALNLAEQAVEFMAELDKFQELREKTVSNFSVSSMVQKTINAYRKFIKK